MRKQEPATPTKGRLNKTSAMTTKAGKCKIPPYFRPFIIYLIFFYFFNYSFIIYFRGCADRKREAKSVIVTISFTWSRILVIPPVMKVPMET